MTDVQRWALALCGWILLVTGAVTTGADLFERLGNPVDVFDCAAPSLPTAPSIELRGCQVTGEPMMDMVRVITQQVESSAYPLGVRPGGEPVALMLAFSRPTALEGHTVHLKRDELRETDLPVFVAAPLRYEEDYGEQLPLPFAVGLMLVGGLIAWFVRPPLSNGGRFVLCMLGVWFGMGTSAVGIILAVDEGPVRLLQTAVGVPVLLYALWRGWKLYPVVSGRTKS
jgi:hypothetical protein